MALDLLVPVHVGFFWGKALVFCPAQPQGRVTEPSGHKGPSNPYECSGNSETIQSELRRGFARYRL